MDVELAYSSRVAFVGRTGSGKTYLARGLLARCPRLLVLDPKGTLGRADWDLTTWGGGELPKGEFRLRVPQPLDNDWDSYLMAAYHAENVTIYIDELYGVEQSSRPSPGLLANVSRGRELGIGVWAATQRPSWVPLIVLSESDWIFEFQLRLEEDKRRMATIIGEEAFTPLRQHNVIVFNDQWESPRLYRQINVTPMTNQPKEVKVGLET